MLGCSEEWSGKLSGGSKRTDPSPFGVKKLSKWDVSGPFSARL